MKLKTHLAVGFLACVTLCTASAEVEQSQTVTIPAPDFLIPLGGQSGVLDVYYDGRPPETSGFNVLGNQRTFVRANTESAGMVTLNLHLPGFDSLDPDFIINTASLQFTVRDLDLIPVQFAPGVTLQETAALTAINGINLLQPIDFLDYLPRGTRKTDEVEITLNPIPLAQAGAPEIDYSEPFVLTFQFTATVTARGLRSYELFNAAESIASDIQLTLSPAPPPVPEPSTLAIAGLMLLVAGWGFRRKGK